MARKTRKTVTEETKNNIVCMITNDKNYKIKSIADALSLDRKTVRKVIQAYEAGEVFVPSITRRKESYERKTQTFTEVDQTIFNMVACNAACTQDEMKRKINEINHVDISQSTISRKLKMMKITRKRLCLVPEERNTVEKIDARAIYAAEISRISDDNLIFLDETGFNKHTRRSYGYSQQNTKAYITVPANRGINKSLICAISSNGVVGYEYRIGSFNKESFKNFINSKLVPYFTIHPNKVLVMDNVAFHKSNEILEVLRANNITFRFTVPYSPQFNPIEEFFSIIKARYHIKRAESPNIGIEDVIDLVLNMENYSVQCSGFYRNMRSWLEKAKRKEPFS